MTLARRSRTPLGAIAAALLVTALGAPVSGLPAQAEDDGSGVVLLTNDGVLPLEPDRSLALITAHPAQLAGTTLAEHLAADAVVDVGPALPARLAAPAPVPAEFLTTAGGRPGLTVEYFAQPDFTELLDRSRVPGVMRGAAEDADPDDVAAVRWAGWLTAPADGRYSLSLAATGRSRLTVDGVEVAVPVPELSATPTIGHGGAQILRSGPVELDLSAGQPLEIEVEHTDSGSHPQAVLGWRTPTDVVPAAVMEAVEAASAADVVIIHVPAVPEPAVVDDDPANDVADEAQPGVLPVDHVQLIEHVVAVNARTVIVLDAASDPSLPAWLGEVAAVLHVPVDIDDAQLLAGLLSGAHSPSGVLVEALLPAGAGEGPAPEEEPEPLFPAGFGLTYETPPTQPRPAEPTAQPGPESTGEPAPGQTGEAGPAAPGGLTGEPTQDPTGQPTTEPTGEATDEPTGEPTDEPTGEPTDEPTGEATGPDQETDTELGHAPPQGDRPPRPYTHQRRSGIPVTGRIPDHASGLYLSVSTDAAAALGEAEFLADRWQLRGSLPAITVVDTRDDTAHTGWTVSAQLTDLAGESQTLPAGNVGWVPSLLDVAEGVSAGPSVRTLLSGGPGLAETAVLGQAAGSARPAQTELGADLVLETGYDTAPGSYAGTLTVTIFPNEAD